MNRFGPGLRELTTIKNIKYEKVNNVFTNYKPDIAFKRYGDEVKVYCEIPYIL